MSKRDDFNTLTLKFAASTVALGLAIGIIVVSVWDHNMERAVAGLILSLLTLFIANSIENEILERYNEKN